MEREKTSRSIRRILVPTDFSSNARSALGWARLFASVHDAKVTLLHVADVVGQASLPLHIQDRIAADLQSLEQVVHNSGVPATSIQSVGRPWQQIASEANDFDLIVMGLRGQTPSTLRSLGIGSTADRVLRLSPVPVLTIPIGDETVREEATLRTPTHVLVATDFSDSSNSAANYALELIKPTPDKPIKITLVHAWQPIMDYEYAFGGAAMTNTIDGIEDEARMLLTRLAERITRPSVEVEIALKAGYPGHAIDEVAQECCADMVFMGTHGRTGVARWLLGSVAERTIHRTTCPVCVVGAMSTMSS